MVAVFCDGLLGGDSRDSIYGNDVLERFRKTENGRQIGSSKMFLIDSQELPMNGQSEFGFIDYEAFYTVQDDLIEMIKGLSVNDKGGDVGDPPKGRKR